MKPANKTNAAIRPASLNRGTTKKSFNVVEKQEIKPKQGFTEFPTAKLASIKTVDPFAAKKGNSFAHLYSSGAIPCKINHGSVNMRLMWNANVTISRTYACNQSYPTTPCWLPVLKVSLKRNTPMASSLSTPART